MIVEIILALLWKFAVPDPTWDPLLCGTDSPESALDPQDPDGKCEPVMPGTDLSSD